MNEPKKNFKIVTDTKARVILPNTLTLIGVCIGLTSINFALNQNYNCNCSCGNNRWFGWKNRKIN